MLVDINGQMGLRYMRETRKISTFSDMWLTDPDLRLLHDRTFRRHTIKPHDYYNVDWFRFPPGKELTLEFLPSTSTKTLEFKGQFMDIEKFLDTYRYEIVFYRISFGETYYSWTKRDSDLRELEACALEMAMEEEA